MNTEDIRKAANCAAMKVGEERAEYINVFPEEYRKDIEYLTNQIDEWANAHWNEEPCKYNQGFTYGI